ncbi:EboA domain-containing protein [Streptomyces sp. NPDC004609]|uniref:EboA domain-containing protein n=1 Tax=Streptomyces sp. NPDC004609 TaxID=3364704 RepID=UPI00369A0CE6
MLRSREELDALLDDSARAWLDAALTSAAGANGPGNGDRPAGASGTATGATVPTPGRGTTPVWELRFAEAGRLCGQEHADSVRVLLLTAAGAGADTLTRLYARGTAAERRALLIALPRLGGLTPPGAALPLVEDALRTNDTRLVAAAVGPYAAEHLDTHAWRHAVLKCLFTGVDVDAVADLERRAAGDGELARMLADFAAERTAAGRATPPDLIRVLALAGEHSEES